MSDAIGRPLSGKVALVTGGGQRLGKAISAPIEHNPVRASSRPGAVRLLKKSTTFQLLEKPAKIRSALYFA